MDAHACFQVIKRTCFHKSYVASKFNIRPILYIIVVYVGLKADKQDMNVVL